MAEDTDHTRYEALFSDHHDGTLLPDRRAELDAHLSQCARCQAEYARFQETLGALSGMHKMSAPDRFDERVATTIHRRSAGRFFGRRAFGDRVPYEAIAVAAFLAIVGILFLAR